MASLNRNGALGGFRIRFRYVGIEDQRSIKATDPKFAQDLRARAEETLRLLESGRWDLPDGTDLPGGTDLASLMLSDHKQVTKPQTEAEPLAQDDVHKNCGLFREPGCNLSRRVHRIVIDGQCKSNSGTVVPRTASSCCCACRLVSWSPIASWSPIPQETVAGNSGSYRVRGIVFYHLRSALLRARASLEAVMHLR